MSSLYLDTKKQDGQQEEAAGAKTKFEQTPAMQQIFRCLGMSANESANKTYAGDEDDREIKPQSLMAFDVKGAEKVAAQQIAPALQQAQVVVDMGKQTRQGLHQDLLNDLSDDFDQLTKNVELKKLQEHFQRRHDENKRNPLNDKKNQSTAYRPANLADQYPGRTP